MKYSREIKVGVLAIVCLFLLIFGFNYLKGVNIFSSVWGYHGVFVDVKGLTEQAPVMVRGYKVGQVDNVEYDFAKDSAFRIDISVDKDINLPIGTKMALVPNGLLGGVAIELQIPHDSLHRYYSRGAYLPTITVPGMMENIQEEVMGDLGETIAEAKNLVAKLNQQLDNDHIRQILEHVDSLSGELTYTSHQLKLLMQNRIPGIVDEADSTLANLQVISSDIREADLATTVAQVDTAIAQVNQLIAQLRSEEGTIGKLINDTSLYTNINSTVVSADSLIVDLKAHPKRYVHFSLFGKKDK